jgi:N,N-dimethylformamidase
MPGGGAVFSVGSIGWSLCLGEQGGDNNVARPSTNALRHLLSTPGEDKTAVAPLAWPLDP